MNPILATTGWPVFDADGHFVAFFAVEADAKRWAEEQPGKHTVGPKPQRITMKEPG